MSSKEATVRIKINKLLEAAGWHFFPEGNAPANIRLESNATIKFSDLDALGKNFEKTSKGFIDFLLLDTKSEDKNPLVGHEDKIRSHYLLTVLQSKPVREFVTRNAVGAAGSMPKIKQSIVENIPIPLPPLATQQAIVAEIEAEEALVAANRELITRFEDKIQATLARVWGEGVPESLGEAA